MPFIARRSRIFPLPKRIRRRSGSDAPNSTTAVSRKGERASSPWAIDIRSIFTSRSSRRYVSKLSWRSRRASSRSARGEARVGSSRGAARGRGRAGQLRPQQRRQVRREVRRSSAGSARRAAGAPPRRSAWRSAAGACGRRAPAGGPGARAAARNAARGTALREGAPVEAQVAGEHLVAPVAVERDRHLACASAPRGGTSGTADESPNGPSWCQTRRSTRSSAFGSTTNSVCSVAKRSATTRACSRSSYSRVAGEADRERLHAARRPSPP